jgi:hypothetical protein
MMSAMDAIESWALIDQARAEGGDDGQEERLEVLLTGRSSEDLQAFDRLYRARLAELYRWDLWGGQAVFEAALADAESLADVEGADEGPEAEGLRYAVAKAHEATHGAELPHTGPQRDWEAVPAGEEWDEDDVDERFPRAAAKAGWDD